MTINLNKCYGVLAHEKVPVFTYGLPGECATSEVITVCVPSDFDPCESTSGDILVTAGGYTYLINELLTDYNGQPCLRWVDDNGKKHYDKLEVLL